MAFLPNNQDPQQQGQQQNQVPAVPQIPTLQGSGGPTVSGSSGATGATNTASPSSAPSTPWQNITSYLNANATQGGNIADTISGNLQGQYNAANQAIGQAGQNYGQQIQNASIPYNQDIANQAAQNPGQFVQNPDNLTAFQKMYNANYQGPQNFSGSSDYSNLQSQVQNAQKQAGLVNQGSEGLMTLLQQAESQGGKNPTPGITALDSLLLQESPENFSKISTAAQPFSGLTNYLSTTQQGLDTAAQNAAKEAAATQSQIQNQFIGANGVAPTMQAKLNQELQAASGQAKDYNTQINDVMTKLNAGQPLTLQESHLVDPAGTLETVNPYGQGSGVFANMLANGFPGFSPSMLAQYYNAPSQVAQPGLANVMTPQELADAQALNQLTGQQAIGAPQQLATPFEVPKNAGSFQDQQALQSLYDTLKGDEGTVFPGSGGMGSVLSNLIPPSQSQSDYLHDMQMLSAYMGLPSPYQGSIQPVQDQTPTGPPYLAPLSGGRGI